MKKITIIILFLTVAATLPAQIERGTVTDADGNIYPTAKLGDYWWMTENLRTKHFNNGDEITLYPDTLFPDYALNTRLLDTIFTTGGSNYDGCKHFTYPNRDPDNEAVYGLNYTWWAAMDARGLCPEGWILPDTNIWINLAASTGYGYRDLYRTRYNGELYADIGRYLRSAQYWKEDDTSIAGTDEFGFNALPSGCLEADGYLAFGEEARFWTPHYVMADGSGMGRRYVTLSYNNDLMDFGSFRSNSTICIRCVKQASEETAVQAVKPAAPDAVYTPAAGKLLLKNIPAGTKLSVYSIHGILQKRLSGENPPESINISDLQSGIYILNIQGDFGSKQYKFIK